MNIENITLNHSITIDEYNDLRASVDFITIRENRARRAPFRLFFIFRFAGPPGSVQKTGHVQNMVRFRCQGQRGGFRRPFRICDFSQYPF